MTVSELLFIVHRRDGSGAIVRGAVSEEEAVRVYLKAVGSEAQLEKITARRCIDSRDLAKAISKYAGHLIDADRA